MNLQLIVLYLLLLCLILHVKFQCTESFTCDSSDGSCGSVETKSGLVDFSGFQYQPSDVLDDDVTISLPKGSCKNTLHNDLFCKFCYYNENGKWKCDQCRKQKERPGNSRYLRAMNAINKVVSARDKGEIDDFTYHTLFTKWLKVYYDVTLLPKDKVEQLFCASYLSIIDSAKDKTVFEDFVYKTWPMKCSSKIPAILYGEINNVVDVSDPGYKKANENSPDMNEIEETLKEVTEATSKKSTTDIDDFRNEWKSLWKQSHTPILKGQLSQG
jgi:hypothetical protein